MLRGNGAGEGGGEEREAKAGGGGREGGNLILFIKYLVNKLIKTNLFTKCRSFY